MPEPDVSFNDNGYGDLKVGASTEIHGVTVGVCDTGTNAQAQCCTNPFGTNVSRNLFVGYVQKTV